MKKQLILTFVLISLPLLSFAKNIEPDKKNGEKKGVENKETVNTTPTWEFFSYLKEFSQAELESNANYKLGKINGSLYQRFIDSYIVKEEVTAGDPTRRTTIHKPTIYNAVRSIEKELFTQLNKNRISQEEASDEFQKVLKVALSALDYDTSTFEDALHSNRRNPKLLLTIFNSVKLTEIQ